MVTKCVIIRGSLKHAYSIDSAIEFRSVMSYSDKDEGYL